MTTRRAAVQAIAGSAVGVLFTPAPWRLIQDSALWSENWPGIPRPVRGEISFKSTHCTLCPAGCAVRARCVGERPVSLAGENGGLCALGVTGHHLPYYPGRVKQGPVEEARAAAARVEPPERVAVLDLRPGRTASRVYRRAMAAAPNGMYLTPAEPPVVVNLSAAKTVLSLGAPLLEGWIALPEVLAVRDRFRLVQVEPGLSRTAALADDWLATADAPALARRMEGPVLVIDREMSPAVVALNRELGGWGHTIAARPDPPGTRIEAVEDRSIRLLYIDESHPGPAMLWPSIEPKLAPGAVVIVFAWSREGYARHAGFVLPAAVYPEVADDLPNGRAATPLVERPEWAVDPVEFITKVNLAEALKSREVDWPAGFQQAGAGWWGSSTWRNPETAI